MRRSTTQRGLTLVEALVAMAVLVIGATGMVGLNRQGIRLNADGRRMTKAVTVAQDLLGQVELWAYDDPRLANRTAANDQDYADDANVFEGTSFDADHAEADLTAGGTEWLGMPTAALVAGGYERYWNVSELDDQNGNGIPDGRRIAVIVRWPQGAGFRRIVLHAAKLNPAPEERL